MAEASLLAQLAALGIRPKKGLGQNFLVDPAHRARIVYAADLTRGDTVLEVGPGPGVLTELLAEQAGRVVAVELDDRLIPFLRERFAGQPHVSIVHADILETNPAELTEGRPYKVVANLPYYITSAVIRHLLESNPAPDVLVLTVQREVAERMVAQPPEMSLLALGTQFYATGKIVARIPAGAFYPVPKVESAVVRLDRRAEPVASDITADQFFAVARAGFSQPRKQLRNSLAAGMGIAPAEAEEWLGQAGVDPKRRAETLTLGEWAEVARLRAAR
ncbi:MAG: 16S rRNA (adenine(1518)-N(6)/adenine(1519)-N(6))-dimethyltransferase RsmA [Anaerolineae bacterium]|jgi:16S rRNA (adenine1518-N6/adenine1519-N6)-dimethyltransferase|nr:16S rRNA (adenine(1518)-N(6)/adenine(1519)-N(6))-dimethyltransferase RsmA [Anaerolineae bacterium]